MKLPRVTEPDEGPNMVHFASPPHMGNVTLCGLTDWYNHREKGKPTKKSVTCLGCLAIHEFCNSGD